MIFKLVNCCPACGLGVDNLAKRTQLAIFINGKYQLVTSIFSCIGHVHKCARRFCITQALYSAFGCNNLRMCVCVCLCVHVCVCVACMCVCVLVPVFVCLCANMRMYVLVCACMRVCMCISAYLFYILYCVPATNQFLWGDDSVQLNGQRVRVPERTVFIQRSVHAHN